MMRRCVEIELESRFDFGCLAWPGVLLFDAITVLPGFTYAPKVNTPPRCQFKSLEQLNAYA